MTAFQKTFIASLPGERGSSAPAKQFVAEYRKVGVNIHKDSSDDEVVFAASEMAEGVHPTGSSNNREQHCACKILEIRVEIIEDIDGISGKVDPEELGGVGGDNLILHFQILKPSDC